MRFWMREGSGGVEVVTRVGNGRLHGQPLRLNKKASGEEGAIKPSYESGANLFIGNLDPEVRWETVWCGDGEVVQIFFDVRIT